MYFKIYKDMYLMYIIKALNKNCSELMYILSHNQVLLFTEFNNKAKKKKMTFWHKSPKLCPASSWEKSDEKLRCVFILLISHMKKVHKLHFLIK